MSQFGLSAHDIYEQVTGGPGTGSLDAAQRAVELETGLEQERAHELRQLADEISVGWQGAAAEGAVGVAAPMADVARGRMGLLMKAHLLLDAQSQMFSHTKNSVVPVPAEPPKGNFLNDVVPWETDLDRQITQYQNDVQHNFAVYGGYDTTSLSNEQQIPREYPSNTRWSGDVSVAESPSSPGDGPRRSGPSSPLPGGGGPNPGSAPSSVDGSGPVSGPGSVSAPPPVGSSRPPQNTDTSGAVPPPGASPGTHPPVVGPQPPPGSQPPPGGLPVAAPGGRAPGSGPDGGRGSGGAPPGRGGGAPGGRGAGGGPGARGGVVGEPGAGGRPGAGVGGVAGDEAGRRGGAGAAGARGAGGAGGFAPLGAGRAGGDEDYEHQRKYLIEPDPEDTFGTGERTAPPVIGLEEE